MENDIEVLTNLNMQIGETESAGDAAAPSGPRGLADVD
jgi:hypothetical protein